MRGRECYPGAGASGSIIALYHRRNFRKAKKVF
jgi:hypothetical protein